MRPVCELRRSSRSSWPARARAATVSGGVVEDLRVVVNGVAPTPVRLTAVEDVVRGQAVSEDLAERAGQVATNGAKPLAHNGYKVALLRNLVKRSIRSIEA